MLCFSLKEVDPRLGGYVTWARPCMQDCGRGELSSKACCLARESSCCSELRGRKEHHKTVILDSQEVATAVMVANVIQPQNLFHCCLMVNLLALIG